MNNEMLTKDYVQYFLEEHRRKGVKGRKIEDTTFSGYVDKCRFITEYIGNIKVLDLTREDIEDFIDKVHKRTCDTTARQVRDLTTSMIHFAKKDGLIQEDILQGEKVTLKESKGTAEKKVISEEDMKIFINYCKEQKYYDLIFAMCTGVRASELAGVCWEDIDFEKGTVYIHRAYMRIKKMELKDGKMEGKYVKEFKDLKSKNSYRTLGLQQELLEMLKEHKEEQKELAKKNNKTFTEQDWVFTTVTYNGYVSDYSNDKFRKVMNTIKIKDYDKLSMHNIRHSFCTLGLMNGVSIEEMQKVMGHANIATTTIYSHILKNKVIEASNRVASNVVKYL